MNNRYNFPISWDQLHRDARALAWRLLDYHEKTPFELVISVTRGGLIPTGIIVRELELKRIETLCVTSYAHQDQSDIRLIKPIAADILAEFPEGQNVLVIDDLADTGRTVEYIKKILPKAHYAAVYTKPQGKHLLDNYVTEVSQDTWLFFPWDLDLTYTQPLKKGAEG